MTKVRERVKLVLAAPFRSIYIRFHAAAAAAAANSSVASWLAQKWGFVGEVDSKSWPVEVINRECFEMFVLTGDDDVLTRGDNSFDTGCFV